MTLHYKKLGEGKPLLILHGLFGSLDNWMTLAKEWSNQHEVWLIDQRNHGQSPHSNDFSYTVMAQDLDSFIQEHQIYQPTIIGHSMGGKTAMEFAVNSPESVGQLIVVDIAPVSYQVHHYAIIEALESVKLDQVKSRKEVDEIISSTIHEFGVRQFLLKNLYWKEKEQLAWRFNLSAIKKEIIPISEWSISEKQYKGKSLFIKGGASEYILPEYSKDISVKFPNYILEEVENAGHWVHAEKKEAFKSIIDQFLSQ